MRRCMVVLALSALLPLTIAPATAGAAVAGRCRLVASVDGEVLTLAFRLKDDGVHDDWRVRFFRDGERVYRRIHTTDRSGAFRVVRTYANGPGRETIMATATQIATGAVCPVTFRV